VAFPDVDSDPTQFLSAWLEAAREAGEPLPEAMTLATIGREGWPAARMVMLRGVDRGLVFFTDLESDKGLELIADARAAAVLHWLNPRHRQVRLVGEAELVSDREADAYWHSRRPDARRTAAASVQSQVITGRAELEERVKELEQHFPDGVDLPRPRRWSGYRIVPTIVEFWEEAADGLHERARFTHSEAGWTVERLSP
jgi:pyridoxamine 5'-phosphate oxidase